MFSPVNRFRVDLASAVRRLSRAQSNETAIDEMVSHFDGLYQEELKNEAGEAKAEKSARKRMGSIYKIAFQIVTSPARTRKGIIVQALMFALFAAIIPVFICATMGVNWAFLINHTKSLYTLTALLFGGGFVAGLGISVAKRIAWKPLALTIFISIIGSGMMLNHILPPDNDMTKKQLTEIAIRQAELEPRVAKIEAQVKNIMTLRDQSPEAWKRELSVLPALVKEENVPFYKEDLGTSGAYLYPSQTKYHIDTSITYSVTLSRTEDLAVAQNAWNKYQATFEDRLVDIHGREESYRLWKADAANYSMLWMKGFKFSASVCLRLGAIFSFLALFGYLLGTVRVFGLDWLRLSRGVRL